MSIRISSSCNHCNSFTEANVCKTHSLKVSEEYTCDQFSILKQLDKSMNCNTCVRHRRDDCAHPDLAADGMLCASWAPRV